VSPEDIINRYTSKKIIEKGYSEEIGEKIRNELLSGSSLPDQLLFNTLKFYISELAGDKGWVLDGFPVSTEQATEMINSKITPQYIVNFKNDLTGSLLETRFNQTQKPSAEFKVLQTATNETQENIINAFTAIGSTLVSMSAIENIESTITSIMNLIDPLTIKASKSYYQNIYLND
jgi:adenylate kinase family enzyme